MPSFRRLRPSPAMVVACLALLVALGGTSYAAFKLPRNSVGSAQLKPHAVHNADLGRNAVRTENVRDGSLLPADFQPGQLQGAALNVLASRHTLRGVYAASGTASFAGETVRDAPTFAVPMPTFWDSHVIPMGGTPPPECPGTAESPGAAPGQLCVFELFGQNDSLVADTPFADVSAKLGFIAQVTALGPGSYQSRGTWAITAP